MTSQDKHDEHPSDEELVAYVAGKVEGERLGDLRVHLSNCVDCLAVTELLRENDEPGPDGGGPGPTGGGGRPPGPDRAHMDLADRLHAEIIQRERDGPAAHDAGAGAIPSNLLVELVGRLALSASAGLRATCRAQLWPRVRAAVGVESPGVLAVGTYDAWTAEIRRVLESPVALDAAARAPAALDAGARATAEILAFPVGRTRPAAPIDTRSSWDTWVQALIVTRLNATWYLSGLDELWPSEGLSAARQLWHEGGLARMDAYLLDSVDFLKPAMDTLALSIMDLAAALDSPWSGILRTITPPAVASAATHALAALRAQDAMVESAVVLRTLLAEHLGEDADAMAIRPLRSESGQLFEVESAVGGLSAIWFAPPDASALRLDYRGHTAFDAVVRASTLTITDVPHGEEGHDEGVSALVALSRFEGVADPYALLFGTDAVSVPRTAFVGGHAGACEALRESLVEGVAGHAAWIDTQPYAELAGKPASVPTETAASVPVETVPRPRGGEFVIHRLKGLAPDPLLGVPQYALAADDRAPQIEVLTDDLNSGGPLSVTITREFGTEALIVGVRHEGRALPGAVVALDRVDALGLAHACGQATTGGDGRADLGTIPTFQPLRSGEHYQVKVRINEE